MEVSGTVISLLPEVTGQGKNGMWRKQEFILEIPSQYPKKVCISLWGDKIDQANLQVNDSVTASIDVESREYNSRWYTEVRAFSEERKAGTDEGKAMEQIAKFWAFGAGTYTPGGYWNAVASQLATVRHLDERRAVEMLATLNMVAWDAIVASNDAKYHYWLLRPSQADPSITLAITPLPNFPSYPSNHATISSAMAEVIAANFPSETYWLRHDAEQAALSRVYGGIHYRFDGDAGLALGKQVAAWALAQSHDMRDAREGHREP